MQLIGPRLNNLNLNFRGLKQYLPAVAKIYQNNTGQVYTPPGSQVYKYNQSQEKQLFLKSTSLRSYSTQSQSNHENLDIIRVPCLSDNYAFIIIDQDSKLVAVVDPSEFKPVNQALEQRSLKLDYVINTHHHWDHTGGNIELKQKYKCKIIGPKADQDRIPGIDVSLGEDDSYKFGSQDIITYDTPGHTKGHVTFYLPQAKVAFTGDTLFVLGCGRLFEGTANQMWSSMQKIKQLPEDTLIFCGHEYTQSNARFAVAVNPGNNDLQEFKKYIDKQRLQNQATVPTFLKQELLCNPFLRPQDPDIKKTLKLKDNSTDLDVFTAIRKAKDSF